jgi:hypothetical protein
MELGSVTLKINNQHTPGTILSVLVAQLVDRLGGDGFWERDYGWGVRVRRPFGARGMSSVRYGIRLGDLKNKQSTHTGPRVTLSLWVLVDKGLLGSPYSQHGIL